MMGGWKPALTAIKNVTKTCGKGSKRKVPAKVQSAGQANTQSKIRVLHLHSNPLGRHFDPNTQFSAI